MDSHKDRAEPDAAQLAELIAKLEEDLAELRRSQSAAVQTLDRQKSRLRGVQARLRQPRQPTRPRR